MAISFYEDQGLDKRSIVMIIDKVISLLHNCYITVTSFSLSFLLSFSLSRYLRRKRLWITCGLKP